MKKRDTLKDHELLDYQPDVVEIEERPVASKIRWVLYLILLSIILAITGAVVFKVDRVIVAQGKLITLTPTIVVQSLNTAIVRSIEVNVGDVVEKDQVLATLDSTFASADLSQLNKRNFALGVQMRRIQAELGDKSFTPKTEEGEDGVLQEQLLKQNRLIFKKKKQTMHDRIATLESKLDLNKVRQKGEEKQIKLLRDIEGSTAQRHQNSEDYRLRLLEAQKNRFLAVTRYENLQAEERVTANELKQTRSEWERIVEERKGQLMEQEVRLRVEFEKIIEEINKAQRMHDLVELRAPEKSIVLEMAQGSVGSIIRQAEPFFTLVPFNSIIEAEVDIKSKDIGRVRSEDKVRVKLDAFPFQRHDTLPGVVRIISEDTHQPGAKGSMVSNAQVAQGEAFYRSRISLISTQLRNVPEGFRLMPGMKVRAEIKIGKRSVISYFLYPIIRALDESLREP